MGIIRVLSLVHGENYEPPSPVDITAEDIHVAQIHNVLARKGILGDWRLAYRDADGEEIEIGMDEELWAALSQFQKDGSALPKVDEMVIEMTPILAEVQASTEVGSIDADIIPTGTEGVEDTEGTQTHDEVLGVSGTKDIEDTERPQEEDEVPGVSVPPATSQEEQYEDDVVLESQQTGQRASRPRKSKNKRQKRQE